MADESIPACSGGKVEKLLDNSKLVERGEEAQKRVEALFDDVSGKADEELEKFQEVAQTFAEEKKGEIDEIKKQIAESGPKVANALKAGFSAFTSALTSNKED